MLLFYNRMNYHFSKIFRNIKIPVLHLSDNENHKYLVHSANSRNSNIMMQLGYEYVVSFDTIIPSNDYSDVLQFSSCKVIIKTYGSV